MISYNALLSGIKKAARYTIFPVAATVIVACTGGDAVPTQITTPTGTHRPPPEAPQNLPNLTFYNPEQLKDGLIQVVNTGEGIAQAYVRGNKSSFGVDIIVNGKVQLGYTVRKEEAISSENGISNYPEGSDVLNPGEMSLPKAYNFLSGLDPGKHKVRISVDPFCKVYESNRRDNNFEFEINVSEDEKAEIVNVSPLELTVFEHCTQRYSWSDNLNTNITFEEWKENGDVVLARTATIGDRKVNYWIHTGEYNPNTLLESTSDSLDEFLDRVHSVFSQTIPYTDRVTGTSINEYDIIVVYGPP